MEKVKITQKKADAIEYLLKVRGWSRESIALGEIKRDAQWVDGTPEEGMRGFLDEELLKALYIGYEAEPEFKENDWVTDIKTGKIARIDHRGYDGELAWVDDDEKNFFDSPRHSTPSEIAEEKERRFFAEHGREPWELKKNDILNDRRENCTVTIAKVIDKEVMTVLFTNGDWEFYNNIVEDSDWRVACFADKRLDVKTNE
ncbi:hypothetical protein [Oceanobacillus sp. FSL H7-0719]|uniref:hypothetical protein n=1 Tax=Oceanobacillus sp. FSL H7-0719 TaxID=2954507 RepID=UPI00325667D7